MDLLSQADPARSAEIDAASLRAKVDERIGISSPVVALPTHRTRPWLRAILAFGVALMLFVPIVMFSRTDDRPSPERIASPDDQAGILESIDLGGGGVKTAAVDGDTIWAMSALSRELFRIDARTGQLTSTYPIDDHVEGVVVGGGYIWLFGYDDGGEVLRFDPEKGVVDKTISLGSFVDGGAHWFAGSLWLSTLDRVLYAISPNGQIESRVPGELKGSGLGYLWVNDPATGLISNFDANGSRGDVVIPTDGVVVTDGSGIKSVVELNGDLWLLEDAAVARFDVESGELTPLSVTLGLHSAVAFDSSLWVTSSADEVLAKINPTSGAVTILALPGKPGGVFEADGSMWMTLYQPGSLVKIDPEQMIASGERVVDVVSNGHRLLCTGPSGVPTPLLSEQPTVLLDANGWIGYGSWSTVQAQLAENGVTSCAHGYLDGAKTPAERADDLLVSLADAGVRGPFVLVSSVDGVHSTRLFARGRADIQGIVLADPVPIGFSDLYDALLPDLGHPPWADLPPDLAGGLGDLGGTRLVVIGHDPARVFLSPAMRQTVGEGLAVQINNAWQEGLAFYAGLSSNSSSIVVESGLDGILWNDSGSVVDAISDVLNAAQGGDS